jgi:hypothetical protein
LERLPGIKRIKRPGLRVATAVTLATILLCSIVSLPVGLISYAQASSAGASGVQHLRAAVSDLGKLSQNPFDTQVIGHARQELQGGLTDFQQVNDALNRFPPPLTLTPVIGSRLGGAKRLAPLAIEGATAGILACDALTLLVSRLRNPLDPASQGITQQDLATLGGYLDRIQSIFTTVTAQINALSPSDLTLDPRLGPGVAQFKAALPKLQQVMQDAKTMLGAAPTLLGIGTPTNYLVQVMDSTEIRPGGGFIGNYGVMTVSAGRLKEVHITDVDLLDHPYEARGGVIAKPPQYSFFSLVPNWSFRDSNLDADFPTSAQNGIANYTQEGGAPAVQGVIAITPWLVRDLMKLTGPITVTEYNNEVVTADTLVNTIHRHQLGSGHGADTTPNPESGSSARKRFTAYLFDNFFAKLKAIAAKDSGPIVKALVNGLHTKDIQFYSAVPEAEKVIVNNHLGSVIEAPKTGDSFILVDSNQTPNKANSFIATSRQETVTVDAQGNATHEVTLTLNWPINQDAYNNTYGIRTLYRDYMRIFIPPSSEMIRQTGWTFTTTGDRFDRTFWGGRYDLLYGSTGTITLKWVVPKAAVKSGATWTYQYLAQRQAGITWSYDMKVVLPQCAQLSGTPSGLSKASPNTLTAKGSLTQDTTFTVNYTCNA